MSALILAGLMLAQSTGITVEANRVLPDVGYRELMTDQPAEAIRRIDGNRQLAADDPAALINRGTALARLGDKAAARNSFMAALASRDRYDLELRDGSWLDSRAAARKAVQMLEQGAVLALK